ncbi:MAG TPA: hydantoinase B/oxoprolinase family protein [Pseudonocardia sp.]|nr:hydantoinase B/oxoprolinase family protein [Pseudonocardia sp.]
MSATYDPVSVEIHRKALLNVTNEMTIALMRTSGSPVVYEAKDFSTCLQDRAGEHLSFSSYAIFHTGSSLIGTKALIDQLGESPVHPGDGWILNDPHTAGAMHQADVAIVMPVFHDGEHLGWGFSNMHVMDIGGVGISGYAPGARNTYEEGLRFPPTHIIREGAIDPEWERYIAANVRIPDLVLNDLRSMIASNVVCQRKFSEVVHRFGRERHEHYCEINKNLTEEAFRARIERLPDGVYEARDWCEFDAFGESSLLPLTGRLEVRGSDLTFTFGGCPQIEGFVNGTRGAVLGQTMSAILVLLGYGDLPFNAGMWRPLTFDLGEPGSIVNSVAPAGVSNSHTEVGTRVCKMAKHLLNQALAISEDPVLRGRIAAQSLDAFQAVGLTGISQHGAPTVVFFLDSGIGCGGPAQTVGDGQDCYGMTISPGSGVQSIETHEAAQPVLFLWRRLTSNAGGPGQHRGGQSLDQAYTPYGTTQLRGTAANACSYVPPRGVGGGYPGATNTYFPVYDTNVHSMIAAGRVPLPDTLTGEPSLVPTKTVDLTVGAGDVIRMISGAGGGLGDPLLREPAAVVKDVRDGYISAAHARSAYGVVLDDTAAGGHDGEGTDNARAAIRFTRIGAVPAGAAQVPSSAGVSVELWRGWWTCAYCGHQLGATGDDWRARAVGNERLVAERMSELDMYVRPRLENPEVLSVERFCPRCAGLLDVEIFVEGSEEARSAQVGIPPRSDPGVGGIPPRSDPGVAEPEEAHG